MPVVPTEPRDRFGQLPASRSVRVTTRTWQAMKVEAARRGETVGGFVERACRAELAVSVGVPGVEAGSRRVAEVTFVSGMETGLRE